MRILGNYILLKEEERKEVTDGGIIIPQSARMEEQTSAKVGIVVLLGGEDVTEHTIGGARVKVGARVAYNSYSSSEILLSSVKHYIVKHKDVMMILD